MKKDIHPVIKELLRLHNLHHCPITVEINTNNTVLSVATPNTQRTFLPHVPPRGTNSVNSELRHFIGPDGMEASYINNTAHNPQTELVASADRNTVTPSEHHGEFTAHLLTGRSIGAPPYYAVLPDGTPTKFEQRYRYGTPGRYITSSTQPGALVIREPFTLYAVLDHETPEDQVSAIQIKLEDIALTTAANFIAADARNSPGYQWADSTIEALREKFAPYDSPIDPYSPLHTALASLPPPARYLAHPLKNTPNNAVGQLTPDLSSLFSEVQMHFMHYYLRERSSRPISFPIPPPSHVPMIGFISARVVELDGATTVYYTKPLMDPSDAAPHRQPFRQVESIVLNFNIHHRTPERNEPITIQSPIYLDQSGDYQTVLISKDQLPEPAMLELFLEQLRPPQDEYSEQYVNLDSTPVEWRRQYIVESLLLGETQATQNLLSQISHLIQMVTAGVQPHHQSFKYEATSDAASTTIQHRTN